MPHSLEVSIGLADKTLSGKCSCVAGISGYCHHVIREGTFFYWGGGGGWAGASNGRVISKFFYKLVKPVLFATGVGSQFFLVRKKLLHVA